MTKVALDLRKSVEENAAFYFEKAKKSRRKMEGAKAAILMLQRRLQKLLAEKDAAVQKAGENAAEMRKAAERSSKRDWFEKFRWFTSSEGFLCVGGRDASTNELLIKKHTEAADLVFHAELPGSPFFVAKAASASGSIGEKTLSEAAAATASYSKAWKAGLQSVDVYYVKPDQVSKEARSGEYIAKGGFMIYGRKTFIPSPLGLAVGIAPGGKVMAGPASAVSKHCQKHVKIAPGDTRPSDAAKKILKRLGLGNSYLDEVIRALPAGEIKVLG